MKLAILYDDNKVFIQMTPEEFAEILSKEINQDAKPIIKRMVEDLKRRTYEP